MDQQDQQHLGLVETQAVRPQPNPLNQKLQGWRPAPWASHILWVILLPLRFESHRDRDTVGCSQPFAIKPGHLCSHSSPTCPCCLVWKA